MKNQSVKKIIVAAVIAALCVSMFALVGCGGNASSSGGSGKNVETTSVEADLEKDLMSGIHHARVEVEGFDPFIIELNADEAPGTVTNFVYLADEGYYDGLTFYRIQDDFCMQGGTKGNSASGNDAKLEKIKGEFSTNGVNNKLADDFKRGTVAMARTNDPDSATSTFFITLNSAYVSSLNGSYAAFGTIDESGMTIVDQIVAKYGPYADQANMGIITDESEQPVISSITIMD